MPFLQDSPDGPGTKLDARKLLRTKDDLKRPLIHHLNADTSWLLQIPRSAEDGTDRAFFNILVDPWFVGSQVEFFWWFHEQEHTEPSAVQSVAELDDFLSETEDLAARIRGNSQASDRTQQTAGATLIDTVVLSLELTDHTHRETLTQLHPSVPVFGLPQSAALVRSWKHFQTVTSLPFYTSGNDWQSNSAACQPGRIRIAGLTEPGQGAALHVGLAIFFHLSGSPHKVLDRNHGSADLAPSGVETQLSNTTESIIYSAHGMLTRHLAHLATASPPVSHLALLSSLPEISVGFAFAGLTLPSHHGAHESLRAQRLLGTKYWFATHGETKVEKGLTQYLLGKRTVTIGEAVEKEGLGEDEAKVGREWAELRSGEGRVLYA